MYYQQSQIPLLYYWNKNFFLDITALKWKNSLYQKWAVKTLINEISRATFILDDISLTRLVITTNVT